MHTINSRWFLLTFFVRILESNDVELLKVFYSFLTPYDPRTIANSIRSEILFLSKFGHFDGEHIYRMTPNDRRFYIEELKRILDKSGVQNIEDASL